MASKPVQAKFHTAPTTSSTLSPTPRQPSARLSHHLADFVGGLLIAIHMRHGYPNVKGRAIPPMTTPRLGRNGNATDIKKVKPPKKILIPILVDFEHFCFVLLAYARSKLS